MHNTNDLHCLKRELSDINEILICLMWVFFSCKMYFEIAIKIIKTIIVSNNIIKNLNFTNYFVRKFDILYKQ